jgi:hypothetical protein
MTDARTAHGLALGDRETHPCWAAVEELLAGLAATGRTFPSRTSVSNRIASYDPGRRLMLETDTGSRWVDVANVRACWETFEQLRRIRRQDVLEPGRCSAFIMALFAQVPGVGQSIGAETYLVLPDATA